MNVTGDRAIEKEGLQIGKVGFDGNILLQKERFQVPVDADDATRNARRLHSFAIDLAGPCGLHAIWVRKPTAVGVTLSFHAVDPDASSIPAAITGAGAAEANLKSGATAFFVTAIADVTQNGILYYPLWGNWRNYFPIQRKVIIALGGSNSGPDRAAVNIEVGMHVISNFS